MKMYLIDLSASGEQEVSIRREPDVRDAALLSLVHAHHVSLRF